MPQAGVLHEVALVAGGRVGVPLQRVLALAQLAREPDDGLVGLELRERGLQQLARTLAAELVHQVHGHVVRRPEARLERVGAGRRETGHRLGVESLLPEHHAVALDVDAAASGTAGQLGVLPRRDVGVGLAVPLGQLLDHHGAGRHVDAEREGLGGEHDPAQAAQEQLLDALLERRQHAGVVGGDAAGQPVEELVVAEHLEVLVGEVRAPLLDEREDLVALLGRGQPQVGVQALLDGGVAADPAEDEHDRGQQPGAVELLDDVGPARDSTRPGWCRGRGRAACRRA